MNFIESQTNIVRFLKKVSPVYQNYFLCRKIFREQFRSGYKALVCFLKNYAYERQGAAPAYSKIALKCVSSKYQNGRNWRVPAQDDAKDLWEDYKNIAKSDYNLFDNKTGKAKVNDKCNPMKADGGIIGKLVSNNTLNIAVQVGSSAKISSIQISLFCGIETGVELSFYFEDTKGFVVH